MRPTEIVFWQYVKQEVTLCRKSRGNVYPGGWWEEEGRRSFEKIIVPLNDPKSYEKSATNRRRAAREFNNLKFKTRISTFKYPFKINFFPIFEKTAPPHTKAVRKCYLRVYSRITRSVWFFFCFYTKISRLFFISRSNQFFRSLNFLRYRYNIL